MEAIIRFSGPVSVLDRTDVDTDQIMPKQFLKRVERTGFGEFLFYDWAKQPGWDLPHNPILVTGRNFGCGSSREHAPWALRDFGIRCVIAPSFADIFFNNCFKNGILPLVLPKAVCAQLIGDAERGANATLTIDLEAQALTRPDGERIAFEVEPSRRSRLLEGLDEIGATVAKAHRIDAFEARVRRSQPWRATTLDGPLSGA
jgi:3-isopropylmalate/(R)-2-methylmalate dehydratase small subunit